MALIYTIALAVLSLINSNKIPNIEIDNSDKFFHAIAYGLLCLIWYLALKANNFSKALLMAVSIAVVYGIIIEVLQGTLTDARLADGYDILANCIGVAFISVFLMIRNKTHIKNI